MSRQSENSLGRLLGLLVGGGLSYKLGTDKRKREEAERYEAIRLAREAEERQAQHREEERKQAAVIQSQMAGYDPYKQYGSPTGPSPEAQATGLRLHEGKMRPSPSMSALVSLGGFLQPTAEQKAMQAAQAEADFYKKYRQENPLPAGYVDLGFGQSGRDYAYQPPEQPFTNREKMDLWMQGVEQPQTSPEGGTFYGPDATGGFGTAPRMANIGGEQFYKYNQSPTASGGYEPPDAAMYNAARQTYVTSHFGSEDGLMAAITNGDVDGAAVQRDILKLAATMQNPGAVTQGESPFPQTTPELRQEMAEDYAAQWSEAAKAEIQQVFSPNDAADILARVQAIIELRKRGPEGPPNPAAVGRARLQQAGQATLVPQIAAPLAVGGAIGEAAGPAMRGSVEWLYRLLGSR